MRQGGRALLTSTHVLGGMVGGACVLSELRVLYGPFCCVLQCAACVLIGVSKVSLSSAYRAMLLAVALATEHVWLLL
jgi:hypothetical protein